MKKILYVMMCVSAASALSGAVITQNGYTINFDEHTLGFTVSRGEGKGWSFKPVFAVLRTEKDPQITIRPIEMPLGMKYYAPTWKPEKLDASKGMKAVSVSDQAGGDGIDLSVLKGSVDGRTADVFASAKYDVLSAASAQVFPKGVKFFFKPAADYALSASLYFDKEKNAPVLSFELRSFKGAYYSVGFIGAPAFAPSELDGTWQPFIWQIKKFPSKPYMTPAFHCTLPAAFVSKDSRTMGVFADSSELPFNPLPKFENSRFGIVLRDFDGNARPMVFAPMLGGENSFVKGGGSFFFKMRIFEAEADILKAYEIAAKELFAFEDMRENALASTNTALENMINFGLSKYGRFDRARKGFAYDTDVMGSTRNDTSLTSLEIALLTDDESIYRNVSYPVLEFMLSRERPLFLMDESRKTQSPSKRLNGPCASVNELATLAGLSGGANPELLVFANKKYDRKHPDSPNDISEKGGWQEALDMYDATADAAYLERARRGADAYIRNNIESPEGDFRTRAFFWNKYAPPFVDFYRLYERTRDKKYLDAAHYGARLYAMFTWMCPEVPRRTVLVNDGGVAPVYPYVSRFAPEPLKCPEEKVPAWRVSEIGLTPEGSGTMIGHRAIFMANLHPWLLRIARDTGDAYLRDIARWAVIGRYANFPGYHMNTARTTVYEKADFPMKPHDEQSANSFHYNHSFPMMTMLVDFLVSDAETRSDYAIKFPSLFADCSAYMQSKFYPSSKGRFYDYDDAVLWMPRKVLSVDSVNVNYLTARGDGRFYIALTNQTRRDIKTRVRLNPQVLPVSAAKTYKARMWTANKPSGEIDVKDNCFDISIPPASIAAVAIDGIKIEPKLQGRLFNTDASDAWKTSFLQIKDPSATAIFLDFGKDFRTVYIYMRDAAPDYLKVVLHYVEGGKPMALEASKYPFEFTVKIGADVSEFEFTLETVKADGSSRTSEKFKLCK